MKRYGAVKVKDPSTDGHTVKLLPLQSFEVICTRHDPTDNYSALVIGDFLLMTEAHSTDNVTVFRFQQKYDTSDWVKISTLFMGNVLICKTIGGVSDKVRLCVYGTTVDPKDDVLTVINPEDVLVKMEPHQILHLVTYDERGEPSKWSLDNAEGLKCVRCETVINDFQNIYDQDSLFCPEPRSHGISMNQLIKDHPPQFFKNEVMGSNGATVEYHFWSCLTSAEINKTYCASNGSYPMGTVVLKGEYENRCVSRKMELMLGVRGKKKLNLERFKAIYSIAKCWNERSLSYIRHSIFNPRINENLDVSDADGWFYMEIPNPSVYFEDFADDSEWKFEESEGTVLCHELKDRYVNGNRVQRFLITGVTNRQEEGLISVGVLVLGASDRGVTKQMRLSFWKIPSSCQFGPPTPVIEVPRRAGGGRTKLREVFEIELEIIDDGVLASEDAITPLCYVDENYVDDNDIDHYGEYVMRHLAKKKIPLLLGTTSGSSTSTNALVVLRSENETSARNIAF